MNAPQVIVICLFVIKVILVAILDGTPKTGTWNFWQTVVSDGLFLALLGWGGFWS